VKGESPFGSLHSLRTGAGYGLLMGVGCYMILDYDISYGSSSGSEC